MRPTKQMANPKLNVKYIVKAKLNQQIVGTHSFKKISFYVISQNQYIAVLVVNLKKIAI